MALLLGAVVIFMVGLPLAAVAWSKAKSLQRPPIESWLDVLHREARRQHLSAAQIEQVTTAVNRGTAAPAGLRVVTVQAATAKAAWLESTLGPRERRNRTTIVVVLLVVAAGLVVGALLAHRASVAVMGAIEGIASSLVVRKTWGWQLRRARRAVQLNAPSVSAAS